jgi:hypothetical protein
MYEFAGLSHTTFSKNVKNLSILVCIYKNVLKNPRQIVTIILGRNWFNYKYMWRTKNE